MLLRQRLRPPGASGPANNPVQTPNRGDSDEVTPLPAHAHRPGNGAGCAGGGVGGRGPWLRWHYEPTCSPPPGSSRRQRSGAVRHTIMSIASFSVDAAVGVVTALTGLIAAAVAATQLSYRHRMMRTATWAQEQVPSASGERKQHLEDMQRWA